MGARHPEYFLTAHPLVPDDSILERVLVRVPQVEDTGHVWRRERDGKGFGIGCRHALTDTLVWIKEPTLLPRPIEPHLGGARVVGLGELLGHC